MKQSNKFCDAALLTNESSVEMFFVNRLLLDLGYSDSQIKPKESIDEITLHRGSKRIKYKPDYVLMLRRRPRVVIDAKSPSEIVSTWAGQCGSYCLEINKTFVDSNPAEYFILTNGLRTEVYKWDADQPQLTLDFADFVDGNRKYKKLKDLIGQSAMLAKAKESGSEDEITVTTKRSGEHRFVKESIGEINYALSWCHQYIYRKDNISQGAAFMEFIKLMFLKLLSDKAVHKKYPDDSKDDEFTVPEADVQFSVRWIENLEASTANPVADIAFRGLRKTLEDEISVGKKKRIFDPDEELSLSPETIRGVVNRIESIDLYSIDADLNGRLFETFLNATMRGKDLGQYFTPRSVVKLMVRLAGLEVGATAAEVPVVLDPCCGSGGFLIDALWQMWQAVDGNQSLNKKQREDLKMAIACQKIVGIDAGKEPPIARIARINMYLHGDGGSGIYQADSLDKECNIDANLSSERKKELRELKGLIDAGLADVILTNPPFSKVYEAKHSPEKKIISEYAIGTSKAGGRKIVNPSVKSNAMFMERYWDFLVDGGRVVAVVDDSILGGRREFELRQLILQKYIVEAVISLPGDAFQRSKARVKTSVIVLRKKTDPSEEQPPVFMCYCTAVGVDDSARLRVLPIDQENRQRATAEIKRVGSLFDAFKQGKPSAKPWIVQPDRLANRMDVKFCLPEPGRLAHKWEKSGKQVLLLRDMVDVYGEDNLEDERVVYTRSSDDRVTFLRVRYDGVAESGEEMDASDTDYPVLYKVRENDLVISNINAVHGAIAVVPKSLEGRVVSNEYTICRAKKAYDPRLVWALARSPEARADLVLTASGIGRTRVSWENLRELQLALPDPETIQDAIDLIASSEAKLMEAVIARENAERLIYDALGIDNETAWGLINAFKPPK